MKPFRLIRPSLWFMMDILLTQETKVNHAPQMKVEEYPEVEKFIPYDPLGKVPKTQLLNMCSLVYSNILLY